MEHKRTRISDVKKNKPNLSSIRSTFNLDGRIAVITGGAGLLGQKHGEAILECGGMPVLLDLDEEKAQEISNIILEHYKCLDGIVFNAAILEKMSNIESFDLKTWQKVINVNLTSSFILSKYLILLIFSFFNSIQSSIF